MEAQILINPAAGRGRGKRLVRELAALAGGRGVPLHVSTSAADLRRAAREAAGRGVERLLVAGGDGSWNLVAQELACGGTALAPIPVGTGNDLAHELGYSGADLSAAVAIGLEAPIAPIDLLRAGDRWVCGVCGAGFDGETAAYAQSVRRLRGPLVYVWAVLVTLARFRPPRAVVEHDGGRWEGEVMFVVAANTSRFGGGMRIAPTAEPRDGLLDLVIVRRVSRPRLLALFPRVYSGGHLGNPAVTTLRTTRVSLRLDREATLFGDGEALVPAGPGAVEIGIHPGALRVPTPPRGAGRQ